MKGADRILAEQSDMNATDAPKKGGDYAPASVQYLQILFTPEAGGALRSFRRPAPRNCVRSR